MNKISALHRYIAVLTVACFAPLLGAQELAPVKVPFELLPTQHMAVNIKVNGKGPYRVIFDTGAPISLLNNKVASEAGIFPKGFRPPLFALFGSNGQFDIKTLEVGGVKSENVSVMVMDHPTVAAMARVLGPIEGIVGLSFFGRYRMTIDYRAKEMTFVPNNFEPPDMLKTLLQSFSGGPPQQKILSPGGLLGIRVAKIKGDGAPGVQVEAVFADSPAAQAGLQAGDRLLSLDGRWTDSVLECYQAAAYLEAGSETEAVVRRDGKEQKLRLKVSAGF